MPAYFNPVLFFTLTDPFTPTLSPMHPLASTARLADEMIVGLTLSRDKKTTEPLARIDQ